MINYNRNIFNQIDNEEKAYWLGFIVADGYINTSKHMLRIKLGGKDKSHLIKFIKFVGGSEDMLKKEIHSETGNEVFYVSLYSKEVMKDLLKLGIEQAKSTKERVCSIDQKYYRDFIRGLWDGDGFIRENLTGIGLVGSEEVLSFTQNYFNEKLGIKPLKIYSHCNAFKIEYRSTKKAIPLILNHLYNEKDVALDRKKELAAKI